MQLSATMGRLSVLSLILAAATAAPSPDTLRICVPHDVHKACLKMAEQGKTVGVEMACVPARDRLDCMGKMRAHEADFEPADPEDMYSAYRRFGDAFSVFKEIRTKEEPDAEFRYEAVVVVRKDLGIASVDELRGLKSCHTGVGRNVGYKIPITKLTNMGLLPPLNDTKLSPRENELKALSSYFSKSCIVGRWSPDPETDRRLKQQYSNLCQLCEHPDKCDYPDNNSGYEGALRCLAAGGGDVAFTKVIFVKKFFGMAYGGQPAQATPEHRAADFAYLCPDGSRRAVGDAPCTWAARPWQGYMAADEQHTQALRDAIAKLNDLGEATHADWISSVLDLNNKTLAKDNEGPFKPSQYLEKAKYVDVLERDVLRPRREVRLCTASEAEASKCADLAGFAYSRDVRPAIACVARASAAECLAAVRARDVDLVVADPGIAVNAVSKFALQPVLQEEYDSELKTTAVAVVRKGSSVQGWADLKGKKACMARPGEAAGWTVPVHNLVTKNLIERNNCPYTKALTDFFANVNYSEDPFKCLTSGEGEVAFLDQDSVARNVDGGEFAGETKSADFELLCKDGGRKPIDQFSSCNQGTVPPRVMLSSKQLSVVERDDVLFAMLGAADAHAKYPHSFQLFGTYDGHPDLIFSNAATGFETVHQKDPLSEFSKLHDELKACTPQESKP